MEEEEIKKNVRKGYANIVLNSSSCCSPLTSCCGPTSSPESISKNIGYAKEDLESVPENANLGLGCGNPLAYKKINEGDVVLDLGSGAGFDAFLAANKVGENGKVIGVDMTPEMIAQAKENAKQGNFKNVEFRLGEIEDLPMEDEQIDLVISNCVINLVPNKIKAFQEAFRVLKPGGILMVSDIVLLSELPSQIKQSVDAYVGCIAGASLKDEYLDIITNVGFENIKIHDVVPFPIDFNNFHPKIIDNLNAEGFSLDKLNKYTKSVLSIKIEAKKPNLEKMKILPIDKLPVDIYVPLNSCSCVWSNYMDKVFKVLQPYIKLINFNTKNIDSEEARSHNIGGNCVLIDNAHKFTSMIHLKNKLPSILKEKKLLD